MSGECREQRPLLCEDVSEEEQLPEYTRRRFRLLHRDRASASIKGAAAIINRWPEHWSSALGYWWMSLGMMALLTFVIYNSLIALTLIPKSTQRPIHLSQKLQNPFRAMSPFPEIHMHIFSEIDDKIDLAKYLPYINVAADKYLDFNFNLILILNETGSAENTISAEANNLNALNTIWSQERLYKKNYNLRKNVKITHTTLSRLLELSPLASGWQYISPSLIPFLVKVIAIWDIGGIAINPDILTPRTPNVVYIDKFYNLLDKYKSIKQNDSIEEKPKKKVNRHKEHKEGKKMKHVNNIRDIIEMLNIDSDPTNDTYLQENLTEAENKNNVVFNNGRKLLSVVYLKPKNYTETQYVTNETETSDHKHKHGDARVRYENNGPSDLVESGFSNRLNILPLFLEFLFHDKSKVDTHEHKNNEKGEFDDNLVRRRKHTILIDKIRKKYNSSEINSNEKDKPHTILHDAMNLVVKDPAPIEILKLNDTNNFEHVQENIEELTLDLKGNIIATKAPCHAFIGSIFNNAIHHSSDETVQDFIVDELSQFCKGLLSFCKGIDVILL